MLCRFCGKELTNVILDLGQQPLSNALLTSKQLNESETYYPLKLYLCKQCILVQLPAHEASAKIFTEDYPYYSSQSPSNVSHAKEFAATMMSRFDLERVLEIGSNDGYLLQHFPEDVSVIGVEPSNGPAHVARKKGITTYDYFFNNGTARFLGLFDLVCGINVLAHQSDLHDFVKGLTRGLKKDGVIVMEFPHLLNLIKYKQFDTVYQEHYSYFSLAFICKLFNVHGLAVADVEEIPEHGGSLRVYIKKHRLPTNAVVKLLNTEHREKLHLLRGYANFQAQISKIKTQLLSFALEMKKQGKKVIAYGAAAKGSTLLNYCGLTPDLVSHVVDRSPYKQGKFMPGTHTPIVSEDVVRVLKPDYILILPWNIKHEIREQLYYIKDWGGRFVIPIPQMEVY